MNGIDQILEAIVLELARSPYLTGCKVVSGFSAALGDSPLRQETVAVSLEGLEICEGAFGQYFGTPATGGEVCGRTAVLQVQLSVAVPKKLGGAGCQRVLTAISSAVLAGDFGGSVRSLNVGKISYDRVFGGLVQPITLTLCCIISEGVPEAGERYRDVIVKLK